MLLLHEAGRRAVRTKSVVHGLRRQKNKKERKKARNGTNTLFMTFKEKSYIIMANLASNVRTVGE